MAISRWTAIGCTAAGLSIFTVSTRLLPFHRARHEKEASPTHRDSFATSVVTQNRHRGSQENYSLLIPATRLKNDASDEEILARFTKGFFTGLAFTPERWLLSAIPFPITDILGICAPYNMNIITLKSNTHNHNRSLAINETLAIRSQNALRRFVVGPEIWDQSSISTRSTPSVASLLFGNFLVLDSSLLTSAQRNQLPDDYILHAKPPHAFVEFAWGGEGLGLVGSHRFEVSRYRISQPAGAEEFVKVTFSTLSCIPKTGLAPPNYLMWFHVLYSKFLFSDGIKGVLAE
ncbi:hypothetical protein O1611_g5762 [Lasiodiplodia mahajangana]|uniref:Uncharacterized protein n=1 Tax=Lasiodiplodia mahajangana TaxID=1108764 RepID=A0ACC2JK89_9PEZI|nr:hypothetical protein O1611_g5762 [Lasiodiplodia mahajangana]